ncbi:helix-turn-helix domain-containing protein [Christensenella timonensis]|uniref:helix-turn-helix domain-containing protein n=1 Tax=Christensenella timonensis TaxID=1816678 RepID=UPI00082BFAFC|nr:helix-turn-helix transcriptional regulator [Christensenella timonensis]
MNIKDAIVARFQKLCVQEGIKLNELATRAGITPSTVYSMMDSRRRDLSVLTVKKLCDGLEMSVADFFDDGLFRNLEQEIK